MKKKLILHTLLFLACAMGMRAQALPTAEGARTRCAVSITMPRATLGGLCMMVLSEGVVKASVVNEFGVSLMDFTYSPSTGRVRIVSVMRPMDRWYIRRLLRRDLGRLMAVAAAGGTTYRNDRRHITYTITTADDAE